MSELRILEWVTLARVDLLIQTLLQHRERLMAKLTLEAVKDIIDSSTGAIKV